MKTAKRVEIFYKNVKNVKKLTNWTSIKASIELLKARKIGISPRRYIEFEGFKMNEDRLFKLAKELRILDTYIEEIHLLSGKSKKSIEKLLKENKIRKIKYSTCKAHKLWLLTDKELDEFAGLQIAKKQKLAEDREWYINVACEKSGESYELMSRKMDIVTKKNYTNSMFITLQLYRKSDEELLSLPAYVKQVKSDMQEKITKKALSESWRTAIKEEMNWSFGKLKNEFLRATIYGGGPSLKEYYHYGLYKMSIDEMKIYLSAGNCRKMIRRYADYGGTIKCFKNKSLFNVKFKKFVNRKWTTTDNLTLDKFSLFVQGLDSIIVKPTCGIEGRGIKKYYFDKETNIKEVYEQIMESESIIEECVVQHKEIGLFWNDSLNTMRILTFVDKGVPKVLCAVLKLGTTKIVDNFAAGGIACGINLDNGKLCTDGVDGQGNIHTVHPLSGKQFRGFQIPNWDEIVATSKEAAMVIPQNLFVGWDISLNSEGKVEIIEGNQDPGGYLSQFPFAVSEHMGIGFVYEPYLHF